MKRNLLLLSLLTLVMGFSAMAQTNTYTMITSSSELYDGAKVLIVGMDESGFAYAMSKQNTNNRKAVQINMSGSSITTSVAVAATSDTEPYEITVGGSNGAWTLFDELNGGYLYAASSDKNYLRTQAQNNANGQWNIVVNSNGECVPTAQGENTRNIMRFNLNADNGNPLISCYNSSSTIIEPVYIFKAVGAPTIDPEPTNYPTGFNAEVDRTSIELEWNASTGAQAPRGYLVVGSTGAITVPTDGTPVANDLDASDGHIAYNVLTGTSCEFENLVGNTTYNFAIFPFTNSSQDINYKTDGSYPTASATTANLTSLINTDFNGNLAPFTAYNVSGEQEWTSSSYSGVNFAKISGYASGSSNQNEDWLISPNLFANGKYANVTISFENAFKFDGNALMVMVSGEYDGHSNPNDFQWQDITDDFEWSAGDYVWQESGEVTYQFGNVNALYLAFVYTSTASAASTWEVTDVEVMGAGYDAVEEINATTFDIYPNPAANCISFNAEEDSMIEIIDITGRTVMSIEAVAGQNNVNISELNNGVYFVRMGASVVKFIKK